MITLDHTAFRAAVADLHASADRLRDDRDRIAREVDGLLDGGWSGAAASAYAEGWADWKDGAARVLAGLEAMAHLLDATQADLVRGDDSSGGSLARLSTRLG
jgi:WXG100 family type VII secretion target